MNKNLLSVRNLRTHFYTTEGVVRAVDGINFDIKKGQSLGLVGESGSGKTVTARSIMRLVPFPGKTIDGQILLDGEDILHKSEEEMRKIRGSKIAMTFQDPMTYLNPIMRVGDQIAEAIRIHTNHSKDEAIEKAIEMLELVEIPSPSERVMDYPHHLSGGMRQRILLAIALSCNPELLIADEPTTALDVIIEGDILELIKELERKTMSSLLLITHNLGIAAEICDTIAVMYAGNLMEYSDVTTIFANPKHPYTGALFRSIPYLDTEKDEPLYTIEGAVPDLINPPSGCVFHPRCSYRTEKCEKQKPEFIEWEKGHYVACLRAEDIF